MSEKQVQYKSCHELPCAGCLPANVYLCIKPELVDQGNLEGTIYLKRTIPAQLTGFRAPSGDTCPGEYTYKFTYDDVYLEGENTTLSCDDITGAICKDCLVTFIDEKVNEIKVSFEEVLGIDSSVLDGELLALAGLVSAADTLPYFTGSETAALTTLTPFARTLLAAVSDAGARNVLNTEIGVDVQAQNANLTSLSGLTGASNLLPYFTAPNTLATTTLTASGRALIDDADFPAMRTTLSAAIRGANNDITSLTALTNIAVGAPLSVLTTGGFNISIGTNSIPRWDFVNPNSDFVPRNDAFVSIGSPTKRVSTIHTYVLNFPADLSSLNMAYTNNYTMNVAALTLTLGNLQALANFVCTGFANLRAKGLLS